MKNDIEYSEKSKLLIYSMLREKLDVVNINTLIKSKDSNLFSYTSTSEYWGSEFKNRHNKCHINRHCTSLIHDDLHKLHVANWNIITPKNKDENNTQIMRDELLMSNGITFCYNDQNYSKMVAFVGLNESHDFITNLLANQQSILQSIKIIFDYIEMRHKIIYE